MYFMCVNYFVVVNFSRTLFYVVTTATIHVHAYVSKCLRFYNFFAQCQFVCLSSYRSYIRPRLKFNAIKSREMSAVEGISVSPFQTPKLHGYDVYSAETFTVLQLSPRYDVNVTVFVSGMYMAALKN